MAKPRSDRDAPRAILLELTELERARFRRLQQATGIRFGADLMRFALIELARARGVEHEATDERKTA